MQARCVTCLAEMYGPAVWDFSHGLVKCKCGYTAVPMTRDEYTSALYRTTWRRLNDV